MKRQNLGYPIYYYNDCYNGCFKEDVVKRNETIVKRQTGCPIDYYSDCYDGCF